MPGSSGMRVVGGTARGFKLRSPRRAAVRPTTDLVRNAIFSILGTQALEDGVAADLYAGTGTLGIEALSRGASSVDFVESHAGRCRDIRESLNELGLAREGRVHRGRVERVLDRLEPGYALALAAPPYDDDPWEELMTKMSDNGTLRAGGLLVTDHRWSLELAGSYGDLFRERERRYGDTTVSIYRAGVVDG